MNANDIKSTLYSYPRTPHLPTSPGATSDDKWASKEAIAYLASGIELVVSEKMDGGNVSLYPDYFHGRSRDGVSQPWETYAKQLWSKIRFDINPGWRISCESMYARRSVAYDNLASPLYVFGIWDETNTLLDWDSMTEWAELIGLPVVPTLYRGTSFKDATAAWGKALNTDVSEGFVLRDAGRIAYEDFNKKVAKHVRANHVQTSASWRQRDDFAVNGFVASVMD